MSSISILLEGSNRHQKKAIQYDCEAKGPLLVLAGAGSGKTQILTKRLAYFSIKNKSTQYMVALTFTEAAAREMRERAEKYVASFGTTEKTFFECLTFHSLAFRLLKGGWGIEPLWSYVGFSAPPIKIPDEGLEQIYHQLHQQFQSDYTLLEIIENCKGFRYKGPKGPGIHPVLNQLYIAFYSACMSKNWLRFEDMVPLILYLFKSKEGLLSKCQNTFNHILVDEFQDTSPEQMEFLRLLALPQNNLFLVGDDFQAIYGFRGASRDGIKKLWKLYPEINLMKLQINYRSTPAILNYANSIFSRSQNDLKKKLVPGRVSRRKIFSLNIPVQVKIHANPIQEIKWIARKIDYLIQSQGVLAFEIAILYRVHYLGDYYQEGLAKLLPPSIFQHLKFTTIHQAKGLEFPVVFLLGLENGLLPYGTSEEIKNKHHYDEERRLFYVAVTRAEALLYVCACRKRWKKEGYIPVLPSPYILNCGSLWQKIKLRAHLLLPSTH